MDAAHDHIDAQGFRANVGIVILNEDRQVFLGGRARMRGWQFPQGGIRHGERTEDALYRELAEEVGLGAATWNCSGRPAAGCVTGCRRSSCAATRSPCASARSSAGSCCA